MADAGFDKVKDYQSSNRSKADGSDCLVWMENGAWIQHLCSRRVRWWGGGLGFLVMLGVMCSDGGGGEVAVRVMGFFFESELSDVLVTLCILC